MKSDKKLIGTIALLLAAMFWGFSYGIQNIMSNTLGTFTVLFIKGLACIGMIALAFINKQKFDKKSVIYGLIVGTVTLAGLVFQQMGVAVTTVSKASFISGLYVVFVPIIGLFTKKKPKLRFWLAVAVASVGMYFLCLGDSFVLNYGDICILASAALFAVQIVLIDKFSSEVNLYPFVAIQHTTVMLVSCLMMLITENPVKADFEGLLLPILYVIIFSGLAASVLQNKYQASVDPTIASLLMSLESVFGTLFGWIVLNQTLSNRELIGCVLMLIGIIIAE